MDSSVKPLVLVTGASRGIGRAIACQMVQSGHTVVGTATSEAGAQAISQALAEADNGSAGLVLDVCDHEQIDVVFGQIRERYARSPGIVVNNAAITQDNLLMMMKPEQWQQVINTNLNAIYRICKAAIRPMIKQRWGRVVNISSVVALTGNPGQANYCAAKAGVIGFTKSLAQEVASRGITVNAVAPGFIETDMTRQLSDAQRQQILAQIPMQCMGLPEDIAQSVDFLCSEAARYVTGHVLSVNGGMHMA